MKGSFPPCIDTAQLAYDVMRLKNFKKIYNIPETSAFIYQGY